MSTGPRFATSPFGTFSLALLGVVLVAILPSPLKLLLGGPCLILGVALLVRHLVQAFRDKASLSVLEAENQLLRSRADEADRLRMGILAKLKEGVVVLGEDRRVQLFNPAAQMLLGTSSRLELGGSLVELFREPETRKQIEEAFKGEGGEWNLRREPRVLRLRALPFLSLGTGRGVLLTLDDISRQEALETTRQKFISNASHELKTPVTSIRIAAENLLDGGLVVPEGTSGLKTVLRAVDRMTLLLHDISELSRIETGALELAPEPMAPLPFARQLLEDAAPQAQLRKVDLALDAPEELEKLRLQADPLRLHQLLENLLSNAIKFSPEGAEVRLRLRQEKPYLLWEVKDQGPGIPEGEQLRVFERFYRSASVRGIPGTGLGLAIVKHLARLMGGEVSLKSEPGRGSAFTFRQPLA
jgi:two-component system phosphate regulon sensor histidine kinase PhoR